MTANLHDQLSRISILERECRALQQENRALKETENNVEFLKEEIHGLTAKLARQKQRDEEYQKAIVEYEEQIRVLSQQHAGLEKQLMNSAATSSKQQQQQPMDIVGSSVSQKEKKNIIYYCWKKT